MDLTRMRRAQLGFSLIEVMVVVLVIGILIAIAVPMFVGAKSRAQERQAQVILRTGLTTGLTYWSDGSTFTGFDQNCTATPDSCSTADGVESSLVWVGPGQPALGEVSAVVSGGNSLLLVAQSANGVFFCIAQTSGQGERGRGATFASVDTMPECAGGW